MIPSSYHQSSFFFNHPVLFVIVPICRNTAIIGQPLRLHSSVCSSMVSFRFLSLFFLFLFCSILFFSFFSFSRVLRDSTPRYVGPSVGPSIGRSPFWAAAPKGSMTYAFTHMGSFLLLLLLLLRTPLPQSPGPYLSLEAHIPASRPKSQS